jgi:Uma2 family endonuclease
MVGMVLEPTRYLFRVEDYERAWQLGVFGDDARVELIEGDVYYMTPIGPPHASCVRALNALLQRALGERAVVDVQNPSRISDLSEPEPDLAVLRPGLDRYRDRHPQPADILLLVEVSDTTLAFDRNRKAPMYARARVPEVWIVDIGGGAVEVHREPGPEGYQVVERHGSGASVAPLAFPDVAVAVDEILG